MLHAFANLALPVLSTLEAIGEGLVVVQSLVDALLGVENKGAVLDDLLVEGSAGNDDEAGVYLGFGVRLDVDFVAFLFKDNVVELLDLCAGSSFAVVGFTVKDVGEGVPALGDGLRDLGTGLHSNVEDPDGGVGEVLDRVDAVRLTGDDFDGDLAVVDFYLGDLGGAEIAVAWLAGLELLGEIDPELEANVGASVRVHAGHFCMNDASTSCHEL